jgi:hypothetical protein
MFGGFCSRLGIMVFGCGVWLGFFGYGIGPCQWGLVFLLGVLDFQWFLLESLILAQDERWRRA